MIKFCGNELSALIAKHGKQKTDVARDIGISRARISSWVRGKAEPKPGHLIKIIICLGYSESEAKEVFWTLYN